MGHLDRNTPMSKTLMLKLGTMGAINTDDQL
jgi:hypothetical protein